MAFKKKYKVVIEVDIEDLFEEHYEDIIEDEDDEIKVKEAFIQLRMGKEGISRKEAKIDLEDFVQEELQMDIEASIENDEDNFVGLWNY